jgi:hypothetical protein
VLVIVNTFESTFHAKSADTNKHEISWFLITFNATSKNETEMPMQLQICCKGTHVWRWNTAGAARLPQPYSRLLYLICAQMITHADSPRDQIISAPRWGAVKECKVYFWRQRGKSSSTFPPFKHFHRPQGAPLARGSQRHKILLLVAMVTKGQPNDITRETTVGQFT